MSSLRVLHVSSGAVGGVSSVVRALATVHGRLGIESHAVLLAPRNELRDDERQWSVLDGVHPVVISHQADLRSMREVVSVVRTLEPDVVLCHSHRHLPAAWLGQILGRRRPRLVLWEHHALELRRFRENLLSFVGILLARLIVVVSEGYRREYPLRGVARVLRRPMAVVPNSVPWSPVREQRTIGGSGAVRVGTACRLVPTKSVDVLIEAVGKLNSGGDRRFHLSVAGDGPDRPSLERLILELGLSANVTMLGTVEPLRMPSFYDDLDVYVQSTKAESSALSVLEAGGRGVPVVASLVRGLSEYLTDGETALFFPVDDPAALARAIDAATQEPTAGHLARNLNELVRVRFAPETSAHLVLDLLEQFCGVRRPGDL